MQIKFEFEKETPGTYRFKSEREDAAVTALYLKKFGVDDLKLSKGDRIIVTIEKEEK